MATTSAWNRWFDTVRPVAQPVYSLNAPVPTAVRKRRDELAPALEPFEQRRNPLTLVVKRFGESSSLAMSSLEDELRSVLQSWAPMAARIRNIDAFVEPAGGPGPVVYYDVESPGLEALHAALVDRFGPTDSAIEGPHYVPHVTLARGGERVHLERITGPVTPPIEWTIDELVLWSARYDQRVATITLPATTV